MLKWEIVTTLLENPKEPVKLDNPNTCIEAKFVYFIVLYRLKK